MPYDPGSILMEIAKLGGLEHRLDLGTKDLAEILGCSQQTASLYLIKLSSDGYVERSMKRYGSRVWITAKGLDLMYSSYVSLHALFGRPRRIDVSCKVASGLGEGAYYLAQQGYIDQVREKLGFNPFAGTLNMELSPQDTPVLDLLRKGPGIEILPFESGGRTFGSCLCYRCEIKGVDCAVMVPNRTIHKNTLEIISGVRLRNELDLNDDNTVEVSILYPGGELSSPAGSS